jgi:hypothetical protein
MNNEKRKTGKCGTREKSRAPQKASIHAAISPFFSWYFCTIIPEGIDIKA